MNYALAYDFIAYRESLNKIGYLGASISGDLAKVCRPPPVTMESAEMDADLAFKIHGMVASGLEKHRDDVYHVGNRLRAMEFGRSEEHTSELQSLMRISYAVFCLKKKIQR